MTKHRPLTAPPIGVEWPTVGLVVACYTVWALALFAPMPLVVSVLLAALAIAFHSSLCHEVIHGHPFRATWANEALVWPSLCTVIPYGRFRDTHLAHHRNENLTDPYDDPETNYLDPGDWERLPRALRLLRRANNTLAGRLVLGPLIGQANFLSGDLRAACTPGGGDVRRAWAGHLPSMLVVLALVWWSPMPVWAYFLAVWAGLGIVKIRTFLEHQAAVRTSGRTVIIEDRGVLAFLFLNNNLHAVHHSHPRVSWYRLPQLYRADRARYLGRNGGYSFPSYVSVFRRYLWRAKDPVPHPLWRR